MSSTTVTSPSPSTHTHDALDLTVATSNAGRCSGPGVWAKNLTALSDCDVIVFAEPGKFSRIEAQEASLLPRYRHFYRPRKNDDGYGGVVVLVRDSPTCHTASVQLPPPPAKVDVQAAAVRVQKAGAKASVIIGVYASCVSSLEADNSAIMRYLTTIVRRVECDHPNLPIVLAGDLNARNVLFGDTATCNRGRQLHTWLLDEDLALHTAPSRPASSKDGRRGGSCIDVIITNSHTPVSAPVVRTMIGTDHNAVVADLDPSLDRRALCHVNRLCVPKKLDQPTLVAGVEGSLTCVTGTPHCQEARIRRALSMALRDCGAEVRRVRVPSVVPPPSVEDITLAAKRNPWSAVRLLRPRCESISRNVQAEDMLAEFGSAGKQRNHGDEPLPAIEVDPDNVAPVSLCEVEQAIMSLNPRSCADRDGVSTKVLRMLTASRPFLSAFAQLMTTCLRTGRVPGRWKECEVRAIPKPGKDTAVLSNLRPIYLCAALAKLGDKIVDTRIRQEYVPSPLQCGFRQGVPMDLVPHALLELCSSTLAEKNERASDRKCALLIAVDLSDAFPGTPVKAILEGYRSSGVTSASLLAFKTAMLSGRRMRVHHAGSVSAWDDITDGTNQGFVSGPTDFSAATATLLSSLAVWTDDARSTRRVAAMVADDLSIAITGTMYNIQVAAAAALKLVDKWATKYGMRISTKSQALLLSKKQATDATTSWPYQPLKCGDLRIAPRNTGSIRILGYHVDAKLSMSAAVDHVEHQHHKAMTALYAIGHSISLQQRRDLYDALALSHVRRLGVVLLCLHEYSRGFVDCWQRLDRLIGIGARHITGTTRTAPSRNVIHEASLSDAFTVAVDETRRLRAKLETMAGGSIFALARSFLSRGSQKRIGKPAEGFTGHVVDSARITPDLVAHADYVHIDVEAQATADERALLRQLDCEALKEKAAAEKAQRHAAHNKNKNRPGRSLAAADGERPTAGASTNDGPTASAPRQKSALERLNALKLDLNSRALRVGYLPSAQVIVTDGSVRRKHEDGADRSLGDPGAAAAAIAVNKLTQDAEFAKAVKVGPRTTCSFSAEVWGLDAALTIAENAMELRDKCAPGIPPLFVILTDSQSVLSALHLGPLRQTDARLAGLWRRMLTIAQRDGCRFRLCFVYAHCGFHAADLVDSLAKETARVVNECDVTVPRWVKDAERRMAKHPKAQHDRPYFDESLGGPCAPSRWPPAVFGGCCDKDLRDLCRIRTNAWPELGGHLIGESMLCPKCNSATKRTGVERQQRAGGIWRPPTGVNVDVGDQVRAIRCVRRRDTDTADDEPGEVSAPPLSNAARRAKLAASDEELSMVQHMFVCPMMAGRRRVHRIKDMRDLWRRPLPALAYCREFLPVAAGDASALQLDRSSLLYKSPLSSGVGIGRVDGRVYVCVSTPLFLFSCFGSVWRQRLVRCRRSKPKPKPCAAGRIRPAMPRVAHAREPRRRIRATRHRRRSGFHPTARLPAGVRRAERARAARASNRKIHLAHRARPPRHVRGE